MSSVSVARHLHVTRRIEEVSGIRPITLLIASGIALITAILIITGIGMSHLRQQAIRSSEGELRRLDGVLATAANQSLKAVETRLAAIAEPLRGAADDAALRQAAAGPEIAFLMQGSLERFPRAAAVALIAADGKVVGHVGHWFAADAIADNAFAALRKQPQAAGAVGIALREPQTGAELIPFAYRIAGPQGQFAGAVVALVPSGVFTALFSAVSLPPDAAIVLVRPDGSVLARYPGQTVPTGAAAVKPSDLEAVLGDLAATVVRGVSATDGEWRIEALRALPDYPVAVAVSRNAGQVLAEWAHQGMWFGGFALVLAIAITMMVYLIARQFKNQTALAAMRAERIEAEKIESENARLAAEAELLKGERLSVLGQLTATVAHELRNPLSAIRNTLFTVKELATTGGIKLDRPIARMERSIERCDRIISDLLEYTRNRELNRAAVRFDRWLGDILAEQPVPAPVVLARELRAGDAVAAIDADRLRRVVINLVENAIHALAETAPDREKQVTVRTELADGELILAVEDNGPGIAPQNLGRIFEPLFSTKSFGTGLGLPTVKQIVNQHGGTIGVDSEVGRGTSVTVRLPLEVAVTEDVKVAA